jgi:hypothetical protein
MTSRASLLSAREFLKQGSLGRVRTPFGKRQEILPAFDWLGHEWGKVSRHGWHQLLNIL